MCNCAWGARGGRKIRRLRGRENKGTCVFPLFLFIPISKKPQLTNLPSPTRESHYGLMVCWDRYRTIIYIQHSNIYTNTRINIIHLYLCIYIHIQKKKKKIIIDISVCVFTVAQGLFTFTDPGDDKQTLSRLRSVYSLIFSTFREKSNSLNKHNIHRCDIVLIKTSVFVLYPSTV